MSWKDKLQPASFRGVPFHVESDDTAAGRRVQVHEYPQRDKPYAEDLGRATREINIVAFVIGAEYMAARDQLLGAIEEAGPGTLVHPWYGSLQVVVTSCRVTHSNADGGMARFTLSCVEAGELTFPKAGAVTDAQVRLAADQLSASSVADFADRFSIDGAPAFVVESALTQVKGAIGAVRDGLRFVSGDVGSAVESLLGGVEDLLGSPSSLGAEVFGLFSALVRVADGPKRLFRVVGSLLDVFDGPSLKAPAASTTQSTVAALEMRNTTAVRELVRRALLTQAATAASVTSFPVHDDAVAVRSRLTDAIDRESFTASDPVFAALTDLRVKVRQDMTARSRDSARLSAVTPPDVQPALVLAYDLYEDAARADEIVERNRIAHPGFLPAEPLLVLSR